MKNLLSGRRLTGVHAPRALLVLTGLLLWAGPGLAQVEPPAPPRPPAAPEGIRLETKDVISRLISPDGRWLALATISGTVEIYDATTGARKVLLSREATGLEAGLFVAAGAFAFDPDGSRLAIGYSTGAILLVDIATGAVVRRGTAHDGGILVLAFSRDRKYLVSSGNNQGADQLKLWSMTDGHLVWSIPANVPQVLALAIAANGQEVGFAGQNGALYLAHLDTRTVSTLGPPGGASNWVTKIRFSPDGKLLASVRTDGSLSFWNSPAGTEVATWPGGGVRGAKISDLCFQEDGSVVALARTSPTGTGILQLRKVQDGSVVSETSGLWQAAEIAFTQPGKVRCAGFSGGEVIWDSP